MSGILSGGPTSCANCVQTDCSHSTDLPDLALICEAFVNATFPPDVQDDIKNGNRCHICGAPAIIGGGGRVTCGDCLFRQNAARGRPGRGRRGGGGLMLDKLVARRAREDESSLLHWYPRVKDVLPCPKTVIVELTDDEISSLVGMLDGIPPSPWLVDRLDAAAREIGYPLFLRSDQGSGKHEWKDTCYVPFEGALLKHVAQLVAWHERAGILPLSFRALVFREFLTLDAPFTAFNDMPVARERRYFVRDGKVVCWHSYWVESALFTYWGATPLPPDWQQQLARLNAMDDAEMQALTRMAEIFGEQNPGFWSVDFAMTKAGRWVLIDAARGELSWHPEDCPHNPHPPEPRPERNVLVKKEGP